MIGFKVNGGWLELPKNFRFVEKRTSPIFYGKNFNIISGAYSIPGIIDASDQNRRLLKFPEFLNNQQTENDFPCDLYFNGNKINSGKLNWKDEQALYSHFLISHTIAAHKHSAGRLPNATFQL